MEEREKNEVTVTEPTASNTQKSPPLKRCWWFYAVLVGIALICVSTWFRFVQVIGPGGVYWRSSTELDLRQEVMTVADYEKLQTKMPECNIRWSIPIGDKTFDSQATAIRLGTLSAEDIEHFALFDRLENVDGNGCTDYEALLALYEAYPELDIRWGITLGTTKYANGSYALRLSMDKCSAADLLEKLAWFPALSSVYVSGAMDSADQDAILEKYPHIAFDWEISLLGTTLRSTVEEISFAGQALAEADLTALAAQLHFFPNLTVIDLTDCGFSNERLVQFRNDTGVEIGWNLELLGVTVSSLDEEIDLSNIRITDVGVVEDALPLFSRLKKVVMCDCGISDEMMDALNKRHEDIQFVWMLRHYGYKLRTDTDNFIAARKMDHWALGNTQTSWMTYMEDLIALDLGHMYFQDLDFLYSMPKIQYLIIADCGNVLDFTPIGSLEDLIYAELFLTYGSDLTPLTNCKKLLDLNICFTPVSYDHLVWFLDQMPQLERLWFAGNRFSKAQRTELEEKYPHIEFYLPGGGHSSGGTWRQHPRYFQMRDVFHMYYMTGGTGGAPV